MTNLEKLRAAIIEAVPEIMELKFGCRVVMEDHGTRFTTSIIDRWYPESTIGNAAYMTVGGSKVWADTDFEEILGRPITLADVLRAINELDSDKRPMYFNIGCDGAFYEVKYTMPDGNKCVIEHNGIGGAASWDFSKNLDDQSPETIDFLTSVLCNK